MYECPNCGGNLRFDIPSQKMLCRHCDTRLSPYEVKKETDAIEQEYYEATVFTCPQCAGEIITTDNEAAAFCSFCGASTILSSRIAKEKRPKYILPFKITKENCKEAYAGKMKKAFFAPKELRDPQYIEGFRGIYMPYWTYQLTQKGRVTFNGEKSHREGDYIITEHFKLKGDLDAYYLGYSRDASSTFYDNISEPLAPFDAKQLVNFEPSFLSGFYADTGDVKASVYLDDVTELANESTFEKVCKEPAFKGYQVESENKDRLREKIPTVCKEADNTMYPVWFLSYRNKDRVAYATVNGQTGKVVADIPIDLKKYFISSAILAVPVFLLLSLFFTIKADLLLGLVCLLGLLSAWIYKREIQAIRSKENNEEDEGMQTRNASKASKTKKPKKASVKKKASKSSKIVMSLSLAVIAVSWGIPLIAIMGTFGVRLWALIVVLIGGIMCGIGIAEAGKTDGILPIGFIANLVMLVFSGLVFLCNPISDLWYYAGAVLTLLAVIVNVTDMIRNYNRIAMRRLPQFERRGGDLHA